jgi:hypothetical protein
MEAEQFVDRLIEAVTDVVVTTTMEMDRGVNMLEEEVRVTAEFFAGNALKAVTTLAAQAGVSDLLSIVLTKIDEHWTSHRETGERER